MTQKTGGVHAVLSFSWAYDLFQDMVRTRSTRRWFVEKVLRPVPGQRILDIGCGTAAILESLPGVEYVGIDLSPRYIRSARRRYGDRGCFLAGDVADLGLEQRGTFDIILAKGLLHHLDDTQAARLFETLCALLAGTGRFVSIDATLTGASSRVARFLVGHDRGRHVRPAAALRELAARYYADAATSIHNHLLRIPYTHVIVQCRNAREHRRAPQVVQPPKEHKNGRR